MYSTIILCAALAGTEVLLAAVMITDTIRGGIKPSAVDLAAKAISDFDDAVNRLFKQPSPVEDQSEAVHLERESRLERKIRERNLQIFTGEYSYP